MRKLLAAILFSLALVAGASVQAAAQQGVDDKAKDATVKGTKTAAKKRTR